MRIFIVRHGETDWNKQEIVQGVSDIPLNKTGIQQAMHASQFFSGKHFDALITSPLQRTIETGTILIQNAHVKQIFQDERLIEKNFGICEGWSVERRKKEYPQGHAPNEESFVTVKQRMKEAILDYRQQFQNDILIVSHGAAMAALLKALDPSLQNEFIRFQNVSLTLIDGTSLQILARDLVNNKMKPWLK